MNKTMKGLRTSEATVSVKLKKGLTGRMADEAARTVRTKSNEAVAVQPGFVMGDTAGDKTWFIALLVALVLLTGFVAWSRVQARMVQFDLAEAKQVREEEIRVESDSLLRKVNQRKTPALIKQHAEEAGMARPMRGMVRELKP